MRRPGKIRQRELFDPGRSERVLEGERCKELLLLLARLLQEAATGNPLTQEGEENEPDHV